MASAFWAVTIQIDGHSLTAEIDSGARASIIAAEAAHRLGVNDDALAWDASITTLGILGGEFPGHLHRFGEMRIGPEIVHEPLIEVAGALRPGVDMLLGADFLRTPHVWLSFATGQMFVAPPDTAP